MFFAKIHLYVPTAAASRRPPLICENSSKTMPPGTGLKTSEHIILASSLRRPDFVIFLLFLLPGPRGEGRKGIIRSAVSSCRHCVLRVRFLIIHRQEEHEMIRGTRYTLRDKIIRFTVCFLITFQSSLLFPPS